MTDRDREQIAQLVRDAIDQGIYTREQIADIPMAELLVDIITEQWRRENAAQKAVVAQAKTVTCPYCSAEVGQHCRVARGRRPGRELGYLKYHAARLSASFDREL